MLDFAKVERGKAAYEFAPGQLGEVVARAVDVYRYRAEREGVEVSLRVAGGLPARVASTPAPSSSPSSTCSTTPSSTRKDGGRSTSTSTRAGRFVDVRVSDRGPGIEAEEQERIFERFVRGRHAGETRARGSGIGLALVKHIAESHGGRVRVESPIAEGGRGSAFTLSIPALEAREAPEAGPAEPLGSGPESTRSVTVGGGPPYPPARPA